MDLFPSKIVAINIRNGGGDRVAAICRFLDSHEPDIVMLSEWRGGTAGQTLMYWAKSQGMSHGSLTDGSTPNGVFVAGRMPFEIVTKTPAQRQSSGVLLLAKFQSWTLLAAYFPQLHTKSRFFSTCAEIAKAHENMPFAIIGDLNTGNQLADKSTSGSRYTCADHFDALTKEAGLVDLWRRTNGLDAREWTWLSHRNNGFRIDHAFGNEQFFQFIQPSCVYDHSPREKRITDHSAVIITRVKSHPS